MTVRGRGVALMAAIAAVTGLAATAAPAASAAPAPTPITVPGGLAPSETPGAQPRVAAAAAPAGTVTIVKDTTDAPSCTGYRSQTTPPSSIRVLLTATNTIVTVGFETYVENVLPNEWVPSWDGEALKAGAVAAKSYAWFWVNHYGGYLNTRTPSTCFDVTDDTFFQVYRANSAQTRTNDAVQQTWSVIARDADTHEVRQTFYRSGLTSTPSKDTCGAGANGSTMSQYGTQACATGNKTFTQILNTYYFAVPANQIPALELATATLGPVSAPRPGQVVLSDLNTLVAYRRDGHGNILAAAQPAPGNRFGTWGVINRGPVFAGQPVALKATNNTLVVYAHSGTSILGNGQPAVGAAFSGWSAVGAGSPTVPKIVSDPEVIIAPGGGLVIYAVGDDGNVWGISQPSSGAAFNPWQRLTSTGGFSGTPAALVTASGLIVLYVRNGAVIQGSGQSRRGGAFSSFGTIGSGTASVTATGDPSVFQAGDGTLSVVAGARGGDHSDLWMTGQPAPGVRYGDWRQVSTTGTFTSTVAVLPVSSTGPVVMYADNAGFVQGAQAATAASQFSAFQNIGTGTPQANGDPSTLFAANGAIVIYVIGADGYLWGAGQSAPGTVFSSWGHIGT